MPPPTRRDPLLPAEGPAAAPYSPAASRMAGSIASSNAAVGNTGGPSSAAASAVQSSSLRRIEESWVEVSSQPSSSSLSSIADDIVITGLRVGSSQTCVNGGAMSAAAPATQPPPQQRRRLLQQVEAAASANRPPTSHPATAFPLQNAPPSAPPSSSDGSSQEVYDETESEEDRVLTSSTENITMSAAVPRMAPSFSLMQYQAAQERLRQRAAASDSDDKEDVSDDDDGTALGMPSGRSSSPPTFRPQPNAFSHPPTHLQHQQHQNHPSHRSLPTPHSQVAGSPYVQRRSRSRASRHYSAPNFMSPTYREDNDAALRASLTTLLSCAAAARGLPKKDGNGSSSRVYTGEQASSSSAEAASNGLRPSNQPMGLRLVPESELMGDEDANDQERPLSPRTRTPFQPPRAPQQQQTMTTTQPAAPRSSNAAKQQAAASSRNSAVSAVSTSSKSKRTGTSKSSPRVTKKKRTLSAAAAATDENGVTMISPTLLTWVVSAGVVMLVSVVGFGAGFVIGREVGRQEAASSVSAAASAASGMTSPASNGSSSVSCGHEIMRSSTGSTLRRFRWGAGMANSVAA